MTESVDSRLPKMERRHGRSMSFRRRVLIVLDTGRKGDYWSRVFDVAIVLLISFNVLAVILESVDYIGTNYAGFLNAFELFSVIVFSVEYVLRVWTAVEKRDPDFHHGFGGRVRYMLTPMALIDFLAVAPFYLSFMFAVDLRFMRVLRLLRIFKLTRYSSAMNMLLEVLRKEAQAFGAALFVLMLLMIFSASVIYLAEHQVQPEKFADIPTSMYWAVITLTTVGYGDVTPITALGKFFGAVIGVIGVGMVALPAGILASGFSEQLRLRREEYEDLIDEALEDGHISHEESSALTSIRTNLGLSDEEASEILKRAVKRGVQQSHCPHCKKPLYTEGTE